MLKKQIDALERRPPTIKQREIWWCSLGLNVGVEQDGKNDLFERPVLVVRKFNHRSFIGIPLTTKIKNFPFRKHINYRNEKQDKTREGQLLLTQMRAFDTLRLTRYVGKLGKDQFEDVLNDVHAMLCMDK